MTNNIEKLNKLLVEREEKISQIEINANHIAICIENQNKMSSELEIISSQIAEQLGVMGFSGVSDDLASATIEDSLTKRTPVATAVKVGDILKFGKSSQQNAATGAYTGKVVYINHNDPEMPFKVQIISPDGDKDRIRWPNIKCRSWDFA